MTRSIIITVIFIAAVSNFSFSSAISPNVVSTPGKYISVCIGFASCQLCGGVNVSSSGVTTMCLFGGCGGVQASVCYTFSRTINPETGLEEVDESSITAEYSSPQFKAQIDEEAYKAEFIQQVNAKL